MDLNQEFQQFLGVIVKDPKRVTCDCDAEADKINNFAKKHSLMTVFYDVADPNREPFMCDVEAVHVGITKEGVPSDKPWGWRVAQINVG